MGINHICCSTLNSRPTRHRLFTTIKYFQFIKIKWTKHLSVQLCHIFVYLIFDLIKRGIIHESKNVQYYIHFNLDQIDYLKYQFPFYKQTKQIDIWSNFPLLFFRCIYLLKNVTLKMITRKSYLCHCLHQLFRIFSCPYIISFSFIGWGDADSRKNITRKEIFPPLIKNSTSLYLLPQVSLKYTGVFSQDEELENKFS